MRVVNEFSVVGITVLTLDSDLPLTAYRNYKINGVLYKPVNAYDIGKNAIAIKANGSFVGQSVEFV